MLLIVPGVILALIFGISIQVYLVEDIHGWPAFIRSRILTAGCRWSILSKYFLLICLYLILSALLTAFSNLFVGIEIIGVIVPTVLSQLFSFLSGPLMVAFSYLIYRDLVEGTVQ